MKPKSLLVVGGTGFFGKSILKYIIHYNYLKKYFDKVLSSKQAEFINVFVNPNQKIIPKLQFGKPIEDLSPLLSRSEFKKF